MTSSAYDVVIIGGGIVGLSTALSLSERCPEARVAVLEKEPSVGTHQTARNSMVIHSGVYYTPGSFKARFCMEGRERLLAFCESHGIRWKPCYKTVLATSPTDLPQLTALYEQGIANGVQGLELIGPERLKEFEPHARAIRALYIPHVGAVDFVEVAKAIARDLEARGGTDVVTGARVTAMTRRDGRYHLETTQGPYTARYLITCGGLHADRIARMAGARPPFQLIPFRIMRFLLKPERSHLVRSITYPIPEPGFQPFGVHATRRFDDLVELGPGIALALAREGYTATTVRVGDFFETLRYRGFWSLVTKRWQVALTECRRASSLTTLVRDLQRILPEITLQDVVRFPGGDGILAPAFRPDGTMVNDFYLEEGPAAVHLVNAPSPAATAALALGRHLAGIAVARSVEEHASANVSVGTGGIT